MFAEGEVDRGVHRDAEGSRRKQSDRGTRENREKDCVGECVVCAALISIEN